MSRILHAHSSLDNTIADSSLVDYVSRPLRSSSIGIIVLRFAVALADASLALEIHDVIRVDII